LLARSIKRLCVVDDELNALTLFGRECGAGGGNTLGAGIEGVHPRSAARGHQRQSPLAASDI